MPHILRVHFIWQFQNDMFENPCIRDFWVNPTKWPKIPLKMNIRGCDIKKIFFDPTIIFLVINRCILTTLWPLNSLFWGSSNQKKNLKKYFFGLPPRLTFLGSKSSQNASIFHEKNYGQKILFLCFNSWDSILNIF